MILGCDMGLEWAESARESDCVVCVWVGGGGKGWIGREKEKISEDSKESVRERM